MDRDSILLLICLITLIYLITMHFITKQRIKMIILSLEEATQNYCEIIHDIDRRLKRIESKIGIVNHIRPIDKH
jgi:hypothetical protein